jgi:hypothetical protein
MEDALANNADIREATYEAPLQPASSALCGRDAVAVAAHAGDLNGEDNGVPAALGRSEVNAAAGAGSSMAGVLHSTGSAT